MTITITIEGGDGTRCTITAVIDTEGGDCTRGTSILGGCPVCGVSGDVEPCLTKSGKVYGVRNVEDGRWYGHARRYS
jgi:hypothetical protein